MGCVNDGMVGMRIILQAFRFSYCSSSEPDISKSSTDVHGIVQLFFLIVLTILCIRYVLSS